MAHYCRNCGGELDGQRKFCVHCGVKLEASATTDQGSATDRIGSPVVENVCQSCGSPLRENLKFCTACGQPIAAAGARPAAEPEKSGETGIGAGWPGFLTSLAAALVRPLLGARPRDGLMMAANRLLGGMAMGTALGVLLLAVPIAWIGYALGGLLALVGLVLLFITSQKKEGTRS